MQCPKCGLAYETQPAECTRCGIVIAKFLRTQEAALPRPPDAASQADADLDDARLEREDARQELRARAVALPSALSFAWVAVRTAPGPVRLLAMWAHESGHAVAAWLCGFSAWPGPWFTPVGSERSPSLTVLLAGGLIYGGFRAWQQARWFRLAVCGVTLGLALVCTVMLRPGPAQQVIVFGGDAGCLVLGSAMMLTVYARKEHPVRQGGVRWGLLVLGSLSFADAWAVWSGPLESLPFGENENGLSDPSVLTEVYGWSVLLLVRRYMQLAGLCLAVLGAAWVTGMARAVAMLQGQSTRRWV